MVTWKWSLPHPDILSPIVSELLGSVFLGVSNYILLLVQHWLLGFGAGWR